MRAAWRMPPARRAGDALDESAPVSALLAGHRRAQACFDRVLPLLPEALVGLVRPGPIDGGTWTLFAEHASAAAKLRQLVPTLCAEAAAADPTVAAVRVKIVPRGS